MLESNLKHLLEGLNESCFVVPELFHRKHAQLNFTHKQREIAISLSIFATQFKNLGTPFATTFLAYKALKGCRETE